MKCEYGKIWAWDSVNERDTCERMRVWMSIDTDINYTKHSWELHERVAPIAIAALAIILAAVVDAECIPINRCMKKHSCELEHFHSCDRPKSRHFVAQALGTYQRVWGSAESSAHPTQSHALRKQTLSTAIFVWLFYGTSIMWCALFFGQLHTIFLVCSLCIHVWRDMHAQSKIK